ncbi:MAG: hypothetical protein HN368_05375 [Spirochaetales bacterium]|nr:hypothetical protein [Spirochaetales bacterium]
MYRLDPSEHEAASDDAHLPQHWKHSAPTGNFFGRLDSVSPSVIEGGIEIAVYRDSSDTWSHNIASYSEEKLGSFVPSKREMEEDGPVRSTVRVEGQYGRSTVYAWFRIYKDHPAAELEMRINWNEEFSIAKLCIPFNPIGKREDGVPGGSLNRPLDSKEYPFRDWIKITGENADSTAAVITPDCYGVDVSDQMIRLSILRSPPFAWHYPFDLQENYPYRITDQGEHIIRFAFTLDRSASELDTLAKFMHSPPRIFDWTRGM